MDKNMQTVNCVEDIVPLSSFRATVTQLMSQTKRTHRPIVVTHNGRPSNIFMAVDDYQKMVNQIDELTAKPLPTSNR